MARGRGRGRGRGGGRRTPKNAGQPEFRKSDVFEAEDSDPEEEKQAGKRYDRVESYEYELPADFEDEEIDEDEAFNSEDERMYGHLFAKRKGGGGGGDSESEDEDSDEDEGGSDDDLLDSGEDDDSEVEGSEEEESGESEEEEDEVDDIFGQAGGLADSDDQAEGSSDDDLAEGKSEDEGDAEAHEAMVRAVTGGVADAKRAKQRKRDVVVTEAFPESEFNLPAAGGKGELTLTDLIAGLGDSKAKLGAARKTLERLEKKAAPVAAPLPGPIRERQTRKAGYDAAKEDVEKWMPIVKANREAPTVHFKADTSAVPKTVTTASLVAKHTPETAMEAEVAALLASAGAQSAAAVAEAEEALTLKSLSVAEARERREKLAKMRALLFYHEVKAKRLKKIKSKEYRRRLKKAEKRKAGAAEGDGGFEGLMDEDALRQELEDAEFERAKERLTLKHKNTSRFIRRAIKRGATQVDEGTKEAVAEQLRLGQELRQRVHRIKGAGRSGDSDTDASDTEGSTSGSDSEDAGAGMSSKTRAAALELLEGGSAGADGDVPSKGLFALPFMQRAMDRRRLQAQEEARALLEEGNGTVEHDGATGKSGSGRRAFGGGSEAQRQAERVRRLEAAALASDSEADSDEREDAEAKAERLGRKLRGEDADQLAGDRDADSGANGTVLARAAQHNAVAARDQLFNANGTLRERPSKAHVQGSVVVSVGPAPAKRRQAGNGSGGDGSQPEFDRAKEFAGPRPGYVFKKGSQGVGYYLDAKAPSKQANQTTGKKKPQASKAAAAQRKGDVGSDDEGNMRPAGEAAVAPQGGLSQEDLIRQAFAGDDVAADFAAEKAAEVESELPSEDVPGVMPGWGTWASQQLEPRWAIEAKAKAAAKRAAAAASRKDAGLQYVVVSEKWDKRNAKYRTPTVPFPFDSKDTYERTMRQPLGRDFNTDEAFRNLTRPAVIKDAGVIIQPVRFSKAVAEHSGKAGSGSKRAAVQTVAGGMPKRAKQKS